MAGRRSARTWILTALILCAAPAVGIAATGSAFAPDLDGPSPTPIAPLVRPTVADPPTPEPEPDPTPTVPVQRTASHLFDDAGEWAATWVDVPYVSQLPDMPSGCEVTSIAMLLDYAGDPTTKEEVAEEIPYDWADPDVGFTGNVYDEASGIIYPPALMDLLMAHLGSAVDLTGTDLATLEGYIEAGKPVVVWFEPEVGWSHTVVMTGFTATEVWINDPYGGLYDPWGAIPDNPDNGKDLVMDVDSFLAYWEGSGLRALSY
ncbi:MAG: C39 family peptidase [Propionibacteriaceae bacterium]|jgi:uncharacterized protein YvpB|nr:C39 family peptidase [Propionibacteriaceae bacterium]